MNRMLGCCFGRSARSAAVHSADENETILEKVSPDLSSDEGEGASYQQDLWQTVLQRKMRNNRLTITGSSNTPELFLQSLTTSYSQNGLAQKMPRIREIFSDIEPFVSAINTMVQANTIAALVWGSLTLVFQSVLRFSNLFDNTSQMLFELSRALPRFKQYTEIFHTPRLHQALRDVYEGFVDFCFRTSDILQTNICHALMHMKWASFDNEFQRTRESLTFANSEFDKESRLADVQEQSKRHNEILLQLRTMSTGSSSHETFRTNVTLPRNERFVGRDGILAQIHSDLTPSLNWDFSLRTRCSTVVHAAGGMGKTETVLEYTYRYQHSYSHIFWLRAQTRSGLLDSFLEVIEELGLDVKGLDPEKKVMVGLQWFQTTKSLWLLVFDNAEDFSSIKKFWPASVRGAIIITSQNPLVAHSTKSEVHLQPLTPTEGCSLIQSYLKRGGSEQKPATQLSVSLGGLPLAIAHFAGYIAKSQCPLDQICRSFDKRIRSSRIWSSENVLASNSYSFTLNTVWDLAFHRLSPDAKALLEFISCLDPDQVPVEMFVGSGSEVPRNHWQYWSRDRFDAAVEVLLERHLTERYRLSTGDCLKTHRALQRTVLHRLDADIPRRQQVFDEVVAIARQAFPAANVLKRGDTTEYKQSATYMPQVLSIHTIFRQSDPPIDKKLEFGKLLSDVGYYGVNNALLNEALDLLETGESVCTSLLDAQPEEVRSTLADILGPLNVLVQYLGIDGRRRALEINKRTIKLREQIVAGIPPAQLTQLDFVNLARTNNDMGVSLAQLNQVEEAKPFFDLALKNYQLAGDEETLTARFGHIYSFQLWSLAVAHQWKDVQKLAGRSIRLVTKAVGPDSPLALQTNFLIAMDRFTCGSIEEALTLHKEVFEKRMIRQGPSHHLTLASQYNLAVCYQNIGDPKTAEKHLLDNLANSCITPQWRVEDILRTKFRLSLVLLAAGEETGASERRRDIEPLIESLRSKEPLSNHEPYTDEDDMKLLDFGVAIFHGRTAGMWSDGKHW